MNNYLSDEKLKEIIDELDEKISELEKSILLSEYTETENVIEGFLIWLYGSTCATYMASAQDLYKFSSLAAVLFIGQYINDKIKTINLQKELSVVNIDKYAYQMEDAVRRKLK